MAEAVGLVLGAVALISTFKDCIDLFSTFTAAKSLGTDYGILSTKLDIEKVLLLQWAERVRLLHPVDYDPRLDNKITSKAIGDTLAAIRLLLSESTNLQQLYGLKAADSHTTAVSTTMSHHHMEKFVHDFENLQVRIDISQRHASVKRRFTWAIKDKEKFSHLIRELDYFVSHLHALIPNIQSMPVAISRHCTTHYPACLDLPDTLKDAEAAAEGKRRLCQERILNRLWYRMIDERKINLTDAHRKTFEWALRPPDSDATWDDLSRWLLSDPGIYWISGKAGSGKSTLMKYLYDHPHTKRLLQAWAGSSALILGHFFFWHLGTSEQRTHEGLIRGLLVHVLSTDPSLIPLLLPNMWREAFDSPLTNLELPSSGELAQAFSKLQGNPNNARFCFFIDGLDEYHGNLTHAINFFEDLASNDHIKVLVSSRPTTACMQAFSAKPMLKLQDLTQQDISTYVEDTLGSHPYTIDLRNMRPTSVDSILQEVVDKASGVFLWVILACRSLLEGFAASDYLEELQRRVDELPPELENLFQHILNKVEPRYRQQAAKTLMLRYQKQLGTEKDNPVELSTLGMALFDQQELDVCRTHNFRLVSIEERKVICRSYEARLRSRCCGLLELKPGKTYCFCGENHLTGSRRENRVDSILEFLHRTVFEFLNSPEVWSLECLRIEDAMFQPNAALFHVSIPLLYISFAEDPSPHRINGLTLECLSQAQRIDHVQCTDMAVLTLGQFSEMLLKHTGNEPDGPRQWSSGFNRGGLSNFRYVLETEGRPVLCHSDGAYVSLLLALELEMINTVKYLWSFAALDKTARPAFIRHAIEKPLTRWLQPVEFLHIGPHGLAFLLTEGCDPNATFADYFGLQVTAWNCYLAWLCLLPRHLLVHPTSYDSILSAITTTDLLVRTGADLNVAKTVLNCSLSSWVDEYLVRSLQRIQFSVPDSDTRGVLAKAHELLRLITSMETEHAPDANGGQLDGDEIREDHAAFPQNSRKRSETASTSRSEVHHPSMQSRSKRRKL